VYGAVVKRSNVSEPIPENAKSKDVAADDNPPEVGIPENIKETIIDEKSDKLVEPIRRRSLIAVNLKEYDI